VRQSVLRAEQLTKSAGFLGGFAASKTRPSLHSYHHAYLAAFGQSHQFPSKRKVFLMTRLYLEMKVAPA
jgi:hypothetical protein